MVKELLNNIFSISKMERENEFTLFEKTKSSINSHWHIILIGIVVLVVIILLYMSEKFALPGPQAKNNIWTAGAGLRQQSIDSASNRGWNDLPEISMAPSSY